MKSIGFAILALALTIGPGRAQAQNLLANPNFDADISGWTVAGGSVGSATWDGTDGSPTAGSLLLDSTGSSQLQVYQCLPVTAGQSYDLGASVLPGSTAPSNFGDGLSILTVWFTDTACSAYPGLSSQNLQPASGGTWARYGVSTQAAPAGTQSVLFLIRVTNVAGLPSLNYRVDRAFYGPAGTVPVELQTFRVD